MLGLGAESIMPLTPAPKTRKRTVFMIIRNVSYTNWPSQGRGCLYLAGIRYGR